MTEDNKIIPRSIRATQDDFDKFTYFCKENDMSQSQAFGRIMDILSIENAKAAVPGRATEIDEFQRFIKAISDTYLRSIEYAEDTEVRIRDEFERQLTTKDASIADYQQLLKEEREKVANLKEEKISLQTVADESAELKKALEQVINEQNEAEMKYLQQLKDKEEIISMLQDKLTESEKKATGYDSLKAERDILATDLLAAQNLQKEQQKDFEIQLERTSVAAEKAQNKAVAAIKTELMQKVDELKERLQQTQIEAERQLRVIEKESSAEIRKLEKENAKLREMIALSKMQKTDKK